MGQPAAVKPDTVDEDGEEIAMFPEFEENTCQEIQDNPWIQHQFTDLLHEQEQLNQQIENKKCYFNRQIQHANLLRALINVHIGAGQLTADTLLQESWLLTKFESREKALEERVQNRLKDLQDAKRLRIETERKFGEKQEQIQELQHDLKVLDEHFLEILPDNQKAADWLTKVFRKKIKRKKVDESKKNDDNSDDD